MIKRLLYDEGFTIAGARRHLRDQVSRSPSRPRERGPNVRRSPEARARPQPSLALNRKTLLDLRDSLRSFLTLLEHE